MLLATLTPSELLGPSAAPFFQKSYNFTKLASQLGFDGPRSPLRPSDPADIRGINAKLAGDSSVKPSYERCQVWRRIPETGASVSVRAPR
jgi:hypothetical protein